MTDAAQLPPMRWKGNDLRLGALTVARVWPTNEPDETWDWEIDNDFGRDMPESEGRAAAERAIVEAIGEMATVGWQPIDTAPKDGSKILVFREDAGFFTIHYVAASDFVPSDDDKPQWWTVSGEDISSNMPTHWMPLPPPPVSEDER